MKLMEFYDEQKLNPQWKVSDAIKKGLSKLGVPEDSKMVTTVDKLGGIPLDFMLGYKPFTIRQAYVYQPSPEAARPIYLDPDDVFNHVNSKQ